MSLILISIKTQFIEELLRFLQLPEEFCMLPVYYLSQLFKSHSFWLRLMFQVMSFQMSMKLWFQEEELLRMKLWSKVLHYAFLELSCLFLNLLDLPNIWEKKPTEKLFQIVRSIIGRSWMVIHLMRKINLDRLFLMLEREKDSKLPFLSYLLISTSFKKLYEIYFLLFLDLFMNCYLSGWVCKIGLVSKVSGLILD